MSRRGFVMKMVQVMNSQNCQAIELLPEFRFTVDRLSIRREGDAIILEPLRDADWPEGFFEDIRVDDPAFERTEQGSTPAAPALN